MFRQLDLRDRLLVVAAAPLLVIATVVVGLLIFVNTSDTRPFALFALAGLLIAGFISISVIRSIVSSLEVVADRAAAIAAAHRATQTASPQPIETTETGTIGRVVGAINEINATVIETDRSHNDEVREGLRSIVTNLARRSQTLLDRQVEYLDRLESSEEDPDRLDQLFKVDHLATRMRRNAESLIVLAEADPGRRRGGPVDIADVLRVAMGEVEIYQQIELSAVDEGQLSAANAVDLAHLAAELMENATQFSPPSTPVHVTGRFNGEGRFLIAVADQGMGMADDRIIATNQLLANPPELGLGMGRSLGFMVIGRLAQRLNATVTVERNSQSSGLTATVSVPADLFMATKTAASSATSLQRSMSNGDTAEMLRPLGPPPRPNRSLKGTPASTTSAAVSAPDGPAATDTSAGADEEVVTPFDWGVGSVVDDAPTQATDEAADDQGGRSLGPAPSVPLTRSTEYSPKPESQSESGSGIESGYGSEGETGDWVPPEVTPASPSKLAEAVPSGDAFESGVASLLNGPSQRAIAERPPRGLRDEDATAAGLTKRQRGGGDAPISSGRPVAATKRDPQEVRSRLMRYREGLSGRKPKSGDDLSKSTQPKSSQSKSSQADSDRSGDGPNPSEGR